LIIAASPEEVPECTDTEAAGLSGVHRWGLILPDSSRVSLLTYTVIVAVRPELVMTQIGHFVSHAHTVARWLLSFAAHSSVFPSFACHKIVVTKHLKRCLVDFVCLSDCHS